MTGELPAVQAWRKEHCYADDDCVVTDYRGEQVSVDLSELWAAFDAALGGDNDE